MVRYHLVFSSFWFSDCVAVIQLAESCPITSCCFLIFVAGTADQERPEVFNQSAGQGEFDSFWDPSADTSFMSFFESSTA